MELDFEPVDRTKVAIYKLGEEPSDFLFWQSQPFIARIKALAAIRAEYNSWKYGNPEPRLQRVYCVIERTQR
jgi:hypothetical protein